MSDSYEQLSAEEIMILSCWRNYNARAQVRLLDYISDLNDNVNNLVDTSVRNDLRKRVIDPEEIQAWKEKRIRPLPKQIVRCSFCNKLTQEVPHIIAGPGGVYICNECVEVCGEILTEKGYDENGRISTEE